MRVITKKNNNPNQFVLTEERLINRELRLRLESFAEYSVVFCLIILFCIPEKSR